MNKLVQMVRRDRAIKLLTVFLSKDTKIIPAPAPRKFPDLDPQALREELSAQAVKGWRV